MYLKNCTFERTNSPGQLGRWEFDKYLSDVEKAPGHQQLDALSPPVDGGGPQGFHHIKLP